MALAFASSSLALIAFLASGAAQAEPPADWRFRKDDKPVKVAVVAGSIGGYPRAFHERLGEVCTNVEVKNLSKTGIGALAIKQRFREQVLKNRRVKTDGDDGNEYWVFFASGVNSIGMPKTTNYHLKNITVLAHINGMKVLALTPTPWGTDKRGRFRALEGLKRRKWTKHVTDFLMGRLSPAQALGEHAKSRPAGVDGPWDPLELPDIAIDAYDSPLRDHDAAQRDLEEMRQLLRKDKTWQKEHKSLDEASRAAALEADAWMAADVPRWFMRSDLQAFDHIHPNEEGHRIIAEVTCPQVPESWGCQCASLAPAQ